MQRIALVTGGARRVGAAIVRELHAAGLAVVIHCNRSRGDAERLAAELRAARAGSAAVIAADLLDAEAADAVVGAALEALGALDVLVNNAGGQFSAPAEDISENGWRAVHRLSVEAVWSMTRAVATRAMMPGGGLIVFVGFSPLRGIPGFAHASAARAAVANLASGLAIEWSRHGIRTVCVAPGTILTEALREYGDESIARWERSVPLGRLGRPEEVAALIAILASEGGAYVTGTTIVVDGGVDAWGLAEPPPRAPEAGSP
jgi:citronellol/citronellal dehydrogenase